MRDFLTPEVLNASCPYVTQDEIEFMRGQAALAIPSDAVVVMFGTGPGMLIYSLLDSDRSPDWDITLIDIDTVRWAREHYRLSKPPVAAYVDKIHWIEGRDSYEVGLNWDKEWGKAIDLLIIDGDHTEQGVRRDMEAWLPYVKVGGLVFHHDYLFAGTRWENMGREIYPETQPFVDEMMPATHWKDFWRGGCSKVLRRIK